MTKTAIPRKIWMRILGGNYLKYLPVTINRNEIQLQVMYRINLKILKSVKLTHGFQIHLVL